MPDRPHDLEVEVRLPGVVAHLLEGGGRRRAGVVEENVDPAELSDGSRHHGLALGGAGHVGREGQEIGPRRLSDVVRGALENILAASTHGDPRARPGESLDGGPPQPLAASGDDGNLTL